jgi:hypothetical protein
LRIQFNGKKRKNTVKHVYLIKSNWIEIKKSLKFNVLSRMRSRRIKALLVLTGLIYIVSIADSLGQAWTAADYSKALWMTTRFYGAQRSGDNNWTIYNHLPATVPAGLKGKAFTADNDAGYDVSGGWHDCGDHVKFGITQFYSAYMLLKGYSEFPTGYDDKYSFDYNGYNTSGVYTWEGTSHDPNCIPDVLDEMKHECDFLIKCAKDNSTFYYQVGDGNADHNRWETAVLMQTESVGNGGQTRQVCKNPGESTEPSLAAATLALMARLYQPYDATYANLCLTHALYAYNYAKNNKGNGDPTCTGGFYGNNDAWEDDYSVMCAELYWTTGTLAYKTEALQYPAVASRSAGNVGPNSGYTFDYANDGELALYNMAKLGDATALTIFNNRVAGSPTGSVTTGHFSSSANRNGLGIYSAWGGGWGALRYNANASFLLALYLKLNSATITAGNKTTLTNLMYKDIDYIMGSNSNKRSYIVGFTPAAGGPFLAPQYPHHRNVYLRDDNPLTSSPASCALLTIPVKNQQLGALVGGARDASYNDNRCDYVNSEICIDYNAGLVGALGYIKSQVAPVTGACQTCATPKIGSNLSTCSGSIFPLTLTDAGTPSSIPAGVTYTWKRTLPTATSPIGTAGATARIRTIASADCPSFPCQIVVVRDSTGGCSRSDTVTITNTIPTPTLGANPAALCTPSFVNLAVSNTASFPGGTTWKWYFDPAGAPVSFSVDNTQTTSSFNNVRAPGTYRAEAINGSCSATDDIDVTSNNPTPNDQCNGSSYTPTVSISNAGTGPYNWYTNLANCSGATGSVGAGTSYTPGSSISSTTSYWVKDVSAVSGNVGPTAVLAGGSQASWGCTNQHQLVFTANSDFTLKALKILTNWSGGAAASYDIEIVKASDNSVVATLTTDLNSTHPASGTSLDRFTFGGGAGVSITPSTYGTNNLKMRLKTCPANVSGIQFQTGTTTAYPYNSAGGIVSITGSVNNNTAPNTTDYMYFYDWEISTGSTCSCLEVIAKVGTCNSVAPVQLISFTGNLNEGRTILDWVTVTEINNDYFSVERSIDGINFESIARVTGAGNKNGVTLYSFADENTPSGKVYYRLSQFDFNGDHTESSIVTVNNEAIVSLKVAPNPFNNSTELHIVTHENEKAKVKITDLSGLVVYEAILNTNERNSVGERLTAGVYLLQVYVNDSIKTVKIIKQ